MRFQILGVLTDCENGPARTPNILQHDVPMGSVGLILCVFITFFRQAMSRSLPFTKRYARRYFRHRLPRIDVYRCAKIGCSGISVNVGPWNPVPETSAGTEFGERKPWRHWPANKHYKNAYFRPDGPLEDGVFKNISCPFASASRAKKDS